MQIDILIVEDDERLRQNMIELINDWAIGDYVIRVNGLSDFTEAEKWLSNNSCDLVVLDLFKNTEPVDEQAGLGVLQKIKTIGFVPVVFFTGYAYKIQDLKSQVVSVVSKNDGIESLKDEIERVVNSRLALLVKLLVNHVRTQMRAYFWDIVNERKADWPDSDKGLSLSYLATRRLASSLSKTDIKAILDDDQIDPTKVHPMEFYIYPPEESDHVQGEIIKRKADGALFAILTPTCDMVRRGDSDPKTDFVVLLRVVPFESHPTFVKKIEDLKVLLAKEEKSNTELSTQRNIVDYLERVIANRQNARFFFLPGTQFLENSVVDLEDKLAIGFDELDTDFDRIAQLDDPFAQSLTTQTANYFLRIGFPDLDASFVLANMGLSSAA
ncbi:MAG: response regulator [Acidobacteria bacterium]|nr:MAG: response regulator [Acidobacteriota bacterium]REJ98182.1 MAG: response regulator [Acidobacteriota bacterium]REK16925.1 MAG: response regulator [Acidobacteriota bacterium]REK42836.1 MAG: response regulator [Acidobacteriota bacterium]